MSLDAGSAGLAPLKSSPLVPARVDFSTEKTQLLAASLLACLAALATGINAIFNLPAGADPALNMVAALAGKHLFDVLAATGAPLTTLSYWADAQIWAANASPLYVQNAVLHALVAMLAAQIAFQMSAAGGHRAKLPQRGQMQSDASM